MRRSGIWIILLLILLVGLSIFLIFYSEGQRTGPITATTPVPTATPEMSMVTEQPLSTATPEPTATPIPTAVPTPVPTAVPTPTPTPLPTATPVITREVTGEFRSETGAWLNIIIAYSASRNGDKASIQTNVYVESYSLETGKGTDDLHISIDGKDTYVSTGPILITENHQMTRTLLGSAETEVRPGSQVAVSASWRFNGNYGGKELGTLTAQGTVAVP